LLREHYKYTFEARQSSRKQSDIAARQLTENSTTIDKDKDELTQLSGETSPTVRVFENCFIISSTVMELSSPAPWSEPETPRPETQGSWKSSFAVIRFVGSVCNNRLYLVIRLFPRFFGFGFGYGFRFCFCFCFCFCLV
jgi:hypothetical protein